MFLVANVCTYLSPQQQTEALSDLRDQLSLSQAHLKVREEELTQARAELEDLRHILDTGRHKHSEDLALMRQHWNEDVQGLNTELAQARALLQAATGPPPGEAQAETDTQAMMQQVNRLQHCLYWLIGWSIDPFNYECNIRDAKLIIALSGYQIAYMYQWLIDWLIDWLIHKKASKTI